VAKAPARHVSQPTADEGVVGQSNAEQPLSGDRPDVHDRGCARADQQRGKQTLRDLTHCFLRLAFEKSKPQSATSSPLEVKA
jgi:hypothetical protein